MSDRNSPTCSLAGSTHARLSRRRAPPSSPLRAPPAAPSAPAPAEIPRPPSEGLLTSIIPDLPCRLGKSLNLFYIMFMFFVLLLLPFHRADGPVRFRGRRFALLVERFRLLAHPLD